MKYVKRQSLPRVNDPILSRALEQLDEELDKIARVFIDWTDASQDFKTTGTIQATTAKLTGLTDGYIPYHVSDAAGLANSPIFIDGTKVGMGTPNPDSRLHLYNGSAGAVSARAEATLAIENNGAVSIQFLVPNNAWSGILFGDVDSNDIGQLYYHHNGDYMVFRTNATEAMRLLSTGAMTVTGCVADGTCEIMKNEDALAVIDDILKTGSGKKNEYNHERMDMKKIHAKYPFMIHKQIIKEKGKREKIKYFDKLGAKSDLIYVAIGQLVERVEELEARFNN